jgi:hypothetical protein
MMRFTLLLIAVFAGVPLTWAAAQSTPAGGAEEIYTGTVMSVIDPRTLRIAKDGGGEIRVHIPPSTEHETGQVAGPEGQDGLTDLILGQHVRVRTVRWERGILLGHLSIYESAIGTSPLPAMGNHSERPTQPTLEPPSRPQPQVPPAAMASEARS